MGRHSRSATTFGIGTLSKAMFKVSTNGVSSGRYK